MDTSAPACSIHSSQHCQAAAHHGSAGRRQGRANSQAEVQLGDKATWQLTPGAASKQRFGQPRQAMKRALSRADTTCNRISSQAHPVRCAPDPRNPTCPRRARPGRARACFHQISAPASATPRLCTRSPATCSMAPLRRAPSCCALLRGRCICALVPPASGWPKTCRPCTHAHRCALEQPQAHAAGTSCALTAAARGQAGRAARRQAHRRLMFLASAAAGASPAAPWPASTSPCAALSAPSHGQRRVPAHLQHL